MAKASMVDQAIDQFGDELFGKAHVVGLGRVPDDDSESEWRLAVYVERKLPMDALDEKDRVPESLRVDADGERVDVPTRVIEQGPVSLEGSAGLESLE